jgi:hypothetical protein
MFASLTRRAALFALFAVGALLISVILTACGDDDSTVPTETSAVTTTQADGGGDGGSGNGEDGGTAGGFGTATVTVSAGSYELQVEEVCVISDVGIGAVASSDEASLLIAGPQEIAVVTVELPSGELWSAAAAEVVIEGTTMSYSGPAMGPEADSTISVQVFCDDAVTGPGG